MAFLNLTRFFLLPLVLGALLAQPARSAPSREYQVKAAFLFNFSQFVEWPAENLGNSSAPLVIGILGSDPFGSFLDDLVRGEQAHQRPLVIQRYRRVEDIQTCHVLYVGIGETDRLPEILARRAGQSVLTVGESKDFTDVGGMIQFVSEKNRIRFRINVGAAKAAGLKLSSKLLRPAEIVGSEKG